MQAHILFVAGLLVAANLFGAEWRPIFLVNVPIGLAILMGSTGRLPEGNGRSAGHIDVVGAVALSAAVLRLEVPLTFGVDAGRPLWCWTSLAVGIAAAAGFAVYERRLARIGGAPLIDMRLFATSAVRRGLGGIFTLMGCYGSLLFTVAVYLQRGLHESALQSGLTFTAYAVGFGAASLTWSRLPASLHYRVPTVAFAVIAGAAAALAFVTSADEWPLLATGMLAVGGARHGAGFGSLVQRTTSAVPTAQAASLSGMVSTATQLAIVVGIAGAGSLYFFASTAFHLAPMAVVLVAIAAAEALTACVFLVAPSTR